jgi:hypothetical protein
MFVKPWSCLVVALALTAIAVTGCTGSSGRPRPAAASPVERVGTGTSGGVGVKPGSFVAVSGQRLGLFDASSGRVLRWLLTEPYQGMTVTATAVDHTDRIWVTVSRGPACTSNVAGCGPKANSCAGKVITLNPTTGGITTALTASPGVLIADAQPSPDGRYLAFLDGRCDRSYFNQHIRVQDLTTGDSWTIGADLTPCHSLGSLSWASDGKHLVVGYGRSRVTSVGAAAGYGAGTCLAPAAAKIAVVPALSEQPRIKGPTAAAQAGCQIEAVTATDTGFAAIEGCRGSPGSSLSGPVRLIRYSTHLQRSVEATLGACVDGAELRANQTGTSLLGTTYQFCNPPGKPDPKTVAFTDHDHAPATFYEQPNGGEDTFSAISW